MYSSKENESGVVIISGLLGFSKSIKDRKWKNVHGL